MTTAEALERARRAYARQACKETYALYTAAGGDEPLEPDDLVRLAEVAHLLGKDDEAVDALGRAHNQFLSNGEPGRAVRCAYWIAINLFTRGMHAQAAGWLARGQRILDEREGESVERGYLLLPIAIRTVIGGDAAGAFATFTQAVDIGERFADGELITLARHGQGRSLIRLGETSRGIALLDEVMIAVTAGEVSLPARGSIYCSVIEACHEIFDLNRAREWTAALDRWCASQPDIVPYQGQCLVHRAEIMQLHGAWPAALKEAEQARALFAEQPGQAAIGSAFYQLGELQRLRGDFTSAEESYRQANLKGRKPQPGLAWLRLAQGQVDAASATICSALEEAKERRVRARLLAAHVEIALAAHDLPLARTSADELASIANDLNAPFLLAQSAHATGAVLLAEGKPRAALDMLRASAAAWRELEAPYEAARSGLLISQACRALGDADTADIELDSARRAFEELQAAPDLALIEAMTRRPAKASGKLTEREAQVLALVATGKTNRAIADELQLSEKTVARHISNIFTKLDLASRAAATAYAYKHQLV